MTQVLVGDLPGIKTSLVANVSIWGSILGIQNPCRQKRGKVRNQKDWEERIRDNTLVPLST